MYVYRASATIVHCPHMRVHCNGDVRDQHWWMVPTRSLAPAAYAWTTIQLHEAAVYAFSSSGAKMGDFVREFERI